MIDATVIIAAWCAEDTLEQALDSALAQESVTLEVIVIDDASTDGTVRVAEICAAADPRVRVLRQTANGGPAAARNTGLAVARGRWIAILDADDALAPGRLTRMIALGGDRAADAVFDDFQPVDETGNAIGSPHLASHALTAPECWDLETFLAGCQAVPGRPSLGFLKPLLRRDFLRAHDIRYDESLRNGEDFHLIAALLVAGGALWPRRRWDISTPWRKVQSRTGSTRTMSIHWSLPMPPSWPGTKRRWLHAPRRSCADACSASAIWVPPRRSFNCCAPVIRAVPPVRFCATPAPPAACSCRAGPPCGGGSTGCSVPMCDGLDLRLAVPVHLFSRHPPFEAPFGIV